MVSIDTHELQALCDLGSVVNIIPMSICDNVLQIASLLWTEMGIRFTDHSTRSIEGITDDVKVLIEDSCVAADFAILDTGHNENVPIILG
jgi:ABC-type lipopolysaccharide export system ATPase subunit